MSVAAADAPVAQTGFEIVPRKALPIVALALLSPANLAVLFELRKPRPDPAVIQALMRRFVYAAGVTGALQVATLVIMTRLAS